MRKAMGEIYSNAGILKRAVVISIPDFIKVPKSI
jgi:hypothetical protein